MSILTRPISCKELVELITEYLEGTLSRRERKRFEAHIAGCAHCTEYLAQIKLTIEATGRIRERDLDPKAREELLEAFRGWATQGS